ncbi:hypothetical protein BDB01DRAFT_812338 [Pilobolus umbonatus]|nr:hypothetical protein BDB01DRAFT_812338 [Pilobolus umbonatus]
MIDILLNNQVMVTPESICPLTRKMEDMSVLTPRQGARKRSVDLANQQALSNDCISSSLLRKKKPSLHNNTCSIFSMDAATNQPTNDHSVRSIYI